MTRIDPLHFSAIIEKTRSSAKYKALDLPRELLEDLILQEAKLAQDNSDLEHRFREKLHNIVAPYLEEINYSAEIKTLDQFARTNPDLETLKAYCSGLMAKHASSRERLPYLEAFASFLQPYIQESKIIMDLACALDPLILPWLQTDHQPELLCFDVHFPRLAYLNGFFKHFYPKGKAIQQDVLALPPAEKADLALFLKEAHRFEKRRPGCNRAFFRALPSRTIIVSMPAEDLAGKHSLENYHNRLIEEAIDGYGWDCAKVCVGNELIFVIEKGDA